MRGACTRILDWARLVHELASRGSFEESRHRRTRDFSTYSISAVKTTIQTLARFHRKTQEIVASELGENTHCESG